MFTISKWLRPSENEANMHGFNCAYLGVDKVNPYPVGSNDHKQFELGWNEGNELVQEVNNTPVYYPSNEYGDEYV